MTDASSGRCATTLDFESTSVARDRALASQLALVVIWWGNDPRRLGEVLLPEPGLGAFGRDGGMSTAPPSQQHRRLQLVRQLPGQNAASPSPADPYLSRNHLLFRCLPNTRTLNVECVGRRPLRVNGIERARSDVHEGDILEVAGICSFVCVERPASLPPGSIDHVAGEADAHGIAGESPAAWELRRRISMVARRGAHVLITGPSGTGKELVAQAIHAGSSRGMKPLVSRSAPTIPVGVADAELFGSARNYPNAGMSERPGLIGQADGSSLFLDELGELPADVQTRLLRVLDRGDYQRLGDAGTRLADIRFISATRRCPSELAPDLAARFALRISVPGLEQRIEDIPIIARHIVRTIAERDPAVARRYLAEGGAANGQPRFSGALVHALVVHQYSTHVRELERLLWLSVTSSPGGVLDATADVRAALRPRGASRNPDEVSFDEVRAALDLHGGVRERAWRELGLSSRHALTRLLRKLGEVE
jgi:two-component system nitrogen regulation response regulator GlnG/two-component system response regulator HydG